MLSQIIVALIWSLCGRVVRPPGEDHRVRSHGEKCQYRTRLSSYIWPFPTKTTRGDESWLNLDAGRSLDPTRFERVDKISPSYDPTAILYHST